ncbi:MAG TPA: hypothetical protein VIU38_12650 [Anaerolineales bacterium]
MPRRTRTFEITGPEVAQYDTQPVRPSDLAVRCTAGQQWAGREPIWY